jgi:triphosphatase
METELKLSLPASAVDALKADPLLAKARKARKRLDNIYFDTPDRALARASIGLRLRKDGRRWLQTVKNGGRAQGGLHQREEIEFAVSGNALEWTPLAGTEFEAVLESVKGKLAPQFRTLFTRDIRRLVGPTGAQIELVIDQGEIIAGKNGKRREAICELELELSSGSVDDLFEIALALASRHPLVLNNRSKAERGDALARNLPHGASGEPVKAADVLLPPDTDAPAAARLAVENCLAHWQANEAGYLAQPAAGRYESEYLHQLRVGIRRLRVACDPFARLAGWQTETLAQTKSPLRKLGQQLGAARDWDVFIEETWPSLRDALEDAAARTALQEEIDLQQDLAHRQAHAALESRETQRALLLLNRCLAGSKPAATAANDAADQSFDILNSQLDDYRRSWEQGLAELKQLKPQRLHALRIIAKKLRYLTEFTASRYDAEAVEKWLKWLKKAQEVLGSRNDRWAATARIDGLCEALGKRHRKIRRTLHAALETRAWPALDLAPLPDPYWRDSRTAPGTD